MDAVKLDSDDFIVGDRNDHKRGLSWQAAGLLLTILILFIWRVGLNLVVYPAVNMRLEMDETGAIPATAYGYALLLIYIYSFLGAALQATCFYLFVSYLILRKQRNAISGIKSIVERPSERPIVYLRSFDADEKSASIVGWGTEEEQILIALDELGPFVAIGRPSERLPPLGASRLYVKDDKWQVVVEELITNAQLVVLRIGRTKGFWWEVRRVAEKVQPERLLFLVPKDPYLYYEFSVRAEEVLPRPLPPYRKGLSDYGAVGRGAEWWLLKLVPAIGTMGSLRGLIYFEPDWTPRFVTFKMTISGKLRSPGYASLVKALQPVLARLGLVLSVPQVRPVRILSLLASFWVILYFLATATSTIRQLKDSQFH